VYYNTFWYIIQEARNLGLVRIGASGIGDEMDKTVGVNCMCFDDIRQQLKAFDLQVRRHALDQLLKAWHNGETSCQPQNDSVNMHCHTFFSYNGYGHSPTSLAWLAKESGWHALGTVDFDVLDAVEETLFACDRVGVRGAAGMETRVYLPEFPKWEFNSPGEPGILYYVGIGFTTDQTPTGIFSKMRRRAAERNQRMVERLNVYLNPVTIDYKRDVLPLTPSGNATERHMLIALDTVARTYFRNQTELVTFWASKLEMDRSEVAELLNKVAPNNVIRSKLMKRGGVGYIQPGPDTFPPVDEVTRGIIACGAIPTCAWLDGLSEGEQHMDELLESLIAKGVAGLTIIPDRNWNIPDPKLRASKVGELHKVIALARSLDLPIIVGTEMNKAGQRLIDDFNAEPLRPFREDFVRGADFVYGHTVMQRALGLGYQSEWAESHLPTRRQRNQFYAEVGRLVEPGTSRLTHVAQFDTSLGPDKIITRLASGI